MDPGGTSAHALVCSTQSEPDDSCRKQLIGVEAVSAVAGAELVPSPAAATDGAAVAAAAAAAVLGAAAVGLSLSSCCMVLG